LIIRRLQGPFHILFVRVHSVRGRRTLFHRVFVPTSC
jgi:hypothetical protein